MLFCGSSLYALQLRSHSQDAPSLASHGRWGDGSLVDYRGYCSYRRRVGGQVKLVHYRTILFSAMLGLVTILSGCAHTLSAIHAVEPWRARRMREQAWAIINNCASQLSAAKNG